MSTPESLGEIVARRRTELGLSLRQVDDITAAAGRRVSYSTIHDLETQQRSAATPATVLALARALRLPAGQLRAAAGLPPSVMRPFDLPPRAAELNSRERRAVLAVVDALLAAKESR